MQEPKFANPDLLEKAVTPKQNPHRYQEPNRSRNKHNHHIIFTRISSRRVPNMLGYKKGSSAFLRPLLLVTHETPQLMDIEVWGGVESKHNQTNFGNNKQDFPEFFLPKRKQTNRRVLKNA